MKLTAIALVAALAISACGGSAGQPPSAPAAPVAQSAVTFSVALRSAEEVPPVTNAEASCTGSATVTLDRAANSGRFEVELTGCPASAEPTVMHIHRGEKGVNSDVVVNTGLVAGEWKLAGGAGKITKSVTSIDAAVVAAIIANPAGFYLNVHSKLNGPGVVRGQLVKKG